MTATLRPATLLWPETVSGSDLARNVSGLAGLDLHDLRLAWRKLFRREPPTGLSRSLLVRMVAYQLQAKVHGDLSPADESLIESLWREQVSRLTSDAAGLRSPGRPFRRHRPGTVFLREHAGEMHRVVVIHGGFEWRSKRFRSLSEVAKAITGTSWSGPRFFGLDAASGAGGRR